MLSLLWLALAAGAFFLSLYWVLRERRIGVSNQQRAQQSLAEAQRGLEQAQQRLHQLTGLLTGFHDYQASPTKPRSSRELADFAVQTTGLLLGAETVVLFQRDSSSGDFLGVSAKGLTPQKLGELRVRSGEGVLGQAIREGRIKMEPGSFGGETPSLSATESFLTSPYLVAPLFRRHLVCGLLVLSQPPRNEFTPDQARVAALIAKQIELVMDNLDLFETQQRISVELVTSLYRAQQAKQNLPSEPSEQSRRLVEAIADELHLPAILKEEFVYGLLLRDLGKIGVDEKILLKPGPLTQEEIAVMKKHPEIGYHIVREVSFLKGIAPIVLYHQEWVNGQGYPEGLAGEEIPLGARVVGLVDAWEAMTHDRPYRKALSWHHAMAELRQKAGTQFDPKLVDVFLKVVERLERAAGEPAQPSRPTTMTPSAPSPVAGEG